MSTDISDFSVKWGLTNRDKWSIIHRLTAIAVTMEKSRSWPSAHDWKSCIPQKGIEGSNPSFSAKRVA